MIKLKKTSDKVYSYANILIMGESGVGKTHFLGTVPDSEILILNVVSESGMMTLKDKKIDVIDIENYHDMIDAIGWIKKNGSKYNYIGVDSLSQWQKNLEDQLITSDKFKLWKDIKAKTKEVVDEFKKLPFHIVCTTEVKIDKDEESGTFKYLPSMIGASKDDIVYWFDEVYYFDRVQLKPGTPITYRCLTSAASKFPCKTRAGSLPMTVENPNLADMIKQMFGEVKKEKQKEELEEFNGIPLKDYSKIPVKKKPVPDPFPVKK